VDLEDIAGRLYGLSPESFTEARDEAVREARGAGDRELARRVQALRRPTASAALVNGLRSGDPALLEQLLALGPELARAQSEGAGETLRELSGQRRAALQAVVSRAVELSGRAVTPPVRAEVEGTLEAALADPTSAEAVRSGRLVRALSYAGFGGVDLADAVALPERPPRPARPAASASRRRQAAHGGQAQAEQAQAEQARAEQTRAGQARAEAVAAAEAATHEAAGSLDDAVRASDAAHGERAAAAEAVADADQEVTAAEQALVDARERRTAAQRASRSATATAERAASRMAAAQTAAEQARTALDALRRG